MHSFKRFLINMPPILNRIMEQTANKDLLAVSGVRSLPFRNFDALYGDESCEDCIESYYIPGPREDLKKLEEPDRTKTKNPCWQSMRRTEYKCRTDPEFLMENFINYKKKCLQDDCAWFSPRLDLVHYRPSDKLKRKYHRTWIKCVVKKRRVKMVCHCEPVKYQPRSIPPCNGGVIGAKKVPCPESLPCVLGAPDLELDPCKKPSADQLACPKMTMPCCKAAKKPPICKNPRPKVECRKRLTKYPSFSECLIDPLPDSPPVECKCLNKPMMCEVWEYWRKRKA